MKVRTFFSTQTTIALLLCPILFFSLSKIVFTKQSQWSAPSYQLTPPFFRFITSGFWPAAVDGLWISTLQKIGALEFTYDDVKSTSWFYQLATDLDPHFYELYEQAGEIFTFTFRDNEEASRFLQKGIEVFETQSPPKNFWTHPYTLYVQLAVVRGFIEHDWPSAKILFLKAGELPHAPDYLREMKHWLNEENSENILAQKILNRIILTTASPELKEKYRELLKKYE